MIRTFFILNEKLHKKSDLIFFDTYQTISNHFNFISSDSQFVRIVTLYFRSFF